MKTIPPPPTEPEPCVPGGRRPPAKKVPARRAPSSRPSKAPAKAKAPGAAKAKAKAPPARSSKPSRGRVVYARAAGVDLGAYEHYAAAPPKKGESTPVRAFATDTAGLRALVAWLQEHRVTTVAMEATGVYWKPLYALLEAAQLAPVLVNAYDVHHVPGRKSDVRDCQWLQELHRYGLLRGAFVPAAPIRALRTLHRHRQNRIEDGARHLLHIQKALDEMNLPLHHALSDISGESGLRILDAMVAGERQPAVLADLVDERVQCSAAELRGVLTGEYLEEQLLIIEQELKSYRAAQQQIAELESVLLRTLGQWADATPATPRALASATQALAAATAPATAGPAPACAAPASPTAEADAPKAKTTRARHRTPREKDFATQLTRVLGLDLTVIPGLGIWAVLTLVAEIGLEMSAWRSAKAFTSWLGLCPGTRKSGGRILSSRTRTVKSRAATILRMAAMAAGKTDTPLGIFYRRKRTQFGAPKANVATARKLAVLVYLLLSRQETYQPLSSEAYQAKQQARQLAALRKRAAALGYEIQMPKAA
jgi:transposase